MANISDKVTNLVDELEEAVEADGATYCIFIVKGDSDRHVIMNAKTSGEETANLIIILLKQIAKASGLSVKKVISVIERGVKRGGGWDIKERK